MMQDPFFKQYFEFFGQPMPDQNETQKSEANGSGVIISDDGYIVTNNHVVDNAVSIKVTTSDKKTYKAKLIGKDPHTDLAVIKIDAEKLNPAHFASINDVRVGEIAIAVGNPFGLNSTVTSGIVSAIGRGGLGLPNNKDGFGVEYFIQTDAAINPGNSGGGLFNYEGSLIGINSAIATRPGTYNGYGFAIPVDLVQSVVLDLIDDGKVDRGYIGVQIQTVDETIAKSVDLDEVKGALVRKVIKGKAADKAGIEIGDVILEVDGKSVSSSNELQSIIVTKRAGDDVNITLWRDGKTIHKNVRLEPMDEDNSNAGDTEAGDDNAYFDFDKLGFSVEALTSKQMDDLDLSGGAYITKVKRYSVAERSGITAGGAIIKAGRERISSPSDLKKIIKSMKAGDAVMLQIKYKNETRLVALEIPD